MAGLFDAYPEVSADAVGTLPAAPKPPKGLFDAYPEVPTSVSQPRAASGVLESIQAGFQGSAPGLAWRGKLPDLVIDPQHASWWERALSGAAHVGSELPLMIGGAIAGAPAGAALGTAVAPGVGTAVGSLLGAGAGMGAIPAAIRQTLIEAYKSGDVMTAADFWNSVREVAKTTATEAGINAAAMGAGAVAGRVVGKAIAPAIGQSISVPTAIRSIEAADIATQIAAMPTIPAILQGRLPDAQEFVDAAILIGGLKAAHVTASNITSVFLKTGKTPAEQVADAQANPDVAKQMAESKPSATPEPEYVAPSRMEMLKVQENLFTETARLDEMAAKAEAAPLSDPERIEMNALKSRVLDLENQLRAGAPELSRTPTYTADQFVEARKQADTRLAELTAKADTEALTDTERAERVFLSNSLDRPTALAKHFGFEPILTERPTREAIDASAQRLHDDVLRQLKDADEARKAAGLEPLGDDHAEAVAALVRARTRTRAERMGVLPETLYAERPVKIEDVNKLEGEPEPAPAAEPGTMVPEAPAAAGPELDLFGEPVQAAPAPRMEVQNLATQEIPLANLILSKDVPQFKMQANKEGVVQPLGGLFDRTGVGPIQVWERLDGTLEVISGRHRLDLARRSGEETIPAQIHREAEGFDQRQAATLDAQLNIREEQGSVADYAQYFKDAGIDKATAEQRGLLARAKGRTGFAIARDASPDLLASHRAGRLSDEAALVISSTAPGSERLQALGIAAVQEGKTLLYASNLMRSVDMMAAERMMAGEQGDIFGFDDSALKEASAMAKKASSKQRAISEQIAAVSGASKRPELARKMGVNVEDPAAVQAKIIELKQEQYLWDNWPLYPELVAKLRSETLKQDEAPLKPETPAEATARDQEAAAEAMRKATRDQITSTPEFKEWFGASKLVGQDGTPITLYHGTKGDFSEFKQNQAQKFDAGWFGSSGIYVSASPELASAYAMRERGGELTTRPSNVMPVYVRMENPFRVDMSSMSHDQASNFTKQYGGDEGFTKWLKDNGYDGVIGYRDPDIAGKGAEHWEVVVFNPKQIKSAIGNRGTFDPNNPNILFQDRRDTWYKSALGEAINTANIKSAAAQGWLDMLKGQVAKGGVKADEIKWSGVEDWLKLQEPETAKSAAEKGFTLKAYRGVSKAKPYNDTGTVWASTNRDVADAYAKEVFGYDDAAVIEIMVKPTGIPRHDIRKLSPEQAAALEPDQFGNPQKVGIYDNSDDSNLGSGYGHTAIHVPKENTIEIGKGTKITKEQVADYLASNGVKVEEVMLGSTGQRTPQDATIAADTKIIQDHGFMLDQHPEDASRWGVIDPEGDIYVDPGDADGSRVSRMTPAQKADWEGIPDNVVDAIDRVTGYLNGSTGTADNPAKFSGYQLPGGENYRELLLTLPTQERGIEWWYENVHRPEAVAESGGDESLIPKKLEGYDSNAKDDLSEMYADWAKAQKSPSAFLSSHFDQPNILAHIRFNERTDAEGKKVLFIEEIQSDWAQKGKKVGFIGDQTLAEVQEMAKADKSRFYSGRGDMPQAEWDALAERVRQWDLREHAAAGSIPSAPFVGKTDAWVSLAMKRMIRYAAENGFDKVAWTRGEQQVERYSSALRKQVDVIEWKKTPEGVQLVGYKGILPKHMVEEVASAQRNLYAVNDQIKRIVDEYPQITRGVVGVPAETVNAYSNLINQRQGLERSINNPRAPTKVVDTTEKEDSLSDSIGKAMADQIRNDPNQTGTIEGDQITVSSTGMSSFYDRIVPSVMRDVLRKLGVPANVSSGKSVLPKELGNQNLRTAKGFSDLALLPAFVKKGFYGLKREERGIVQAQMLDIGKNHEVLDAIVSTIPIDVMNALTREQLTPQMFFHDPAMLESKGAIKLGGDVPATGDVASALVSISARFAAENPATFENRAGTTENDGTALGTIQGKHGVTPASSVVTGAGGAETPSVPNTVRPTVGKINIPGVGEVMAADITPAMREGAMAGQPLFQKQTDQLHRGSYDIAENLVTTLQGADKSTVVHELGHSWLEEMKADAARPDSPPSIKADWETLRKELAIGENGEISRTSHEQFARSVERYLAEGEAPSRELQSVFARFREWLLDIYKSVMNLNVEINPELRQVLDRMLATDEEIAAARDLGVPRAYVPEAAAVAMDAIVPPPQVRPARRQITPGVEAEQASMQPFADALPPGPGEAPDNIHVNYAYINTPTDVKLAMQRMAEIDQANIQRQRGGTEGVKSWAEANAEQAKYLNDILGGGPDTLHLFEPRDPDAPHVDVRLGILKKLAVGAATDSARLRDVVLQAGEDATVRQKLEYMGSIERARMIQAEFLGERASVARALNALKDVTEGTGEIGRMLEAIGLGDEGKLFQDRTPAEEQAFLKAKLDEILQNYKGKSVLDIAKLHKEIGTLKGTFKLAKEVSQATRWEQIVEGWRAGLLSGPVTHTTNLLGTEAFHVMRPAVDVLSSIIGMARGASPGMGESDRASMSEAVARLTGMLGGVQDGIKVAIAEFKADEATGKTEAYRTAIPGQAGRIIRTPLRLMGAEDALVTTMYTRGEIRTLAIRQAFDEDLNPSTREFAERVSYLQDNPTPEMQVAAETAATRMTFNAPLGEKGVALQGFVNKWNLQWMIPFIRTPINIAKELLRMSPFAPAIGEWRQAFAKGGVERDRALAEMALGSGIMAITMAYAFAGNVSGAGSPDPGKNRGKAGVWQPYSILIGDTWYEYARIQPTGTLMGMAADMAAIWDHMTDEEKDKVPRMLSAAFAQAITNQTFLQGITNFVNAMSDPARFGPRFLQQMAGSAVPNIIGQPTTMADPVVREVNSALEAIQARIPGMRQDLLPKRDWLGEPVQTKERLGVVMPIREQQISDDKVRQEAARLDISMAASPKKTHIGKGTGKLGDVELTPQERDAFEKIGGEFAHGILQNIVNAPGYDQMPDMVKRKVFSNVLTAAHRVAAVQAMPMEKRIAYLQEITEKVQQELTPGDAP